MNKFSFVKKNLNCLIVTVLTVVLAVMALTGSISMSNQFLLEKIGIAVLLAISLGMVVGFLGELSLGHAGFMCIGAYVGGKLASILTPLMGSTDSKI